MDSKTRSPSKITTAANTGAKKKEVDPEPKFTEREQKTILALKNLYLETIKLDVKLQCDIYNLEKAYEERHNKVFDQRSKIIQDLKKSQTGDSSNTGDIKNFWLQVLQNSYTGFISKKDEKILSHLMDVRTKLHNEPTIRFVLEFHFEPNEYFSNKILTKTYYLNCLPDITDPFGYDGAEIYKCEGTKIDWKQKEKENKVYMSFFDFFNPPTLPESIEDPHYCDINAILQNDFELGYYLKERVIPKAILFYTGEIADCQSSGSESNEESDDEEEGEDDDEDDGSSMNTPEE